MRLYLETCPKPNDEMQEGPRAPKRTPPPVAPLICTVRFPNRTNARRKGDDDEMCESLIIGEHWLLGETLSEYALLRSQINQINPLLYIDLCCIYTIYVGIAQPPSGYL